MNFSDIEKVRMPIVYISLSVILGDLCYGIYNDYLWLAVTTASLFFVFIKFKNNLSFTLILIPFFIIGVFISSNYYGLNINEEFHGEITILENRGYYKIAKYKGRKLYIENKNINIDDGRRYLVRGKFIKDINKETGVIGKLDIIYRKPIKDNFIYKLQYLRQKVLVITNCRHGAWRYLSRTRMTRSLWKTQFLHYTPKMQRKKCQMMPILP